MSFLPTSTACSANCAADLFHPAASHGVRAVSVVASFTSVFPQWPVLHAFLRPAPHTLRSFSLTGSRSASPQPLPSRRCSVSLFPAARSSTSRPCSTVESVVICRCCHLQMSRCSLGLCSPSRRSPRSNCPSGQLRSISAVAGVLWATATGVVVPWTLLLPKQLRDLPDGISVPASGTRGYLQQRAECEHSTRRPADVCQPAIELSELASRVHFSQLSRFRGNPAGEATVLQRPFRFEVALVSRVSNFRAHGLKTSAEAFT